MLRQELHVTMILDIFKQGKKNPTIPQAEKHRVTTGETPRRNLRIPAAPLPKDPSVLKTLRHSIP